VGVFGQPQRSDRQTVTNDLNDLDNIRDFKIAFPCWKQYEPCCNTWQAVAQIALKDANARNGRFVKALENLDSENTFNGVVTGYDVADYGSLRYEMAKKMHTNNEDAVIGAYYSNTTYHVQPFYDELWGASTANIGSTANTIRL